MGQRISVSSDLGHSEASYPTVADVLHALTRSVEEEAEPLRRLIADEDSDCIVRDLRAARLEGLEFALRLFRQTELWEW